MRTVVAAALAALLAGCTGAPEQAPEIETMIPGLEGTVGCTISEGPLVYTPETLYEYNNGAAPGYIAHGFRKLVQARYVLESDEDAGAILDIYDMGSAGGAYGIYTAGRPRQVEPWAVGSEGYRFDTVAAAWKGAIYVHAEADTEDRPLLEMAEHLVAKVVEQVPGEPGLPAIATLMPREGMIRNSDRLIAKDLLGHSFLPGGMMAEYSVEGEECTLFFSVLPTPEAAVEAAGLFRAHEEEYGQVLNDDADGFRFHDPGLGTGMIVRHGRHLAGTYGEMETGKMNSVLGELLANLENAGR